MTHSSVRWRDPVFELRCESCREFVALDLDSWRPDLGLAKCKACWRAYFAAKQRGYNADEAARIAKNEANRARYWANRDANRAANREWKAKNREKVAAYNRKYRAEHREKLAVSSALYYAEARPVILAKKRAAYADRAA